MRFQKKKSSSIADFSTFGPFKVNPQPVVFNEAVENLKDFVRNLVIT